MSTKETPEKAASPAYDNNIVAVMLTVVNKIESRKRGRMSFLRAELLNMGFSVFNVLILPLNLQGIE